MTSNDGTDSRDDYYPERLQRQQKREVRKFHHSQTGVLSAENARRSGNVRSLRWSLFLRHTELHAIELVPQPAGALVLNTASSISCLMYLICSVQIGRAHV